MSLSRPKAAGALETAARFGQLDHLPHAQRAFLSGKLGRRMRAKANGRADQAARVRPDQDLTGRRGGLQAGRGVDRVSGHHAVLCPASGCGLYTTDTPVFRK